MIMLIMEKISAIKAREFALRLIPYVADYIREHEAEYLEYLDHTGQKDAFFQVAGGIPDREGKRE